MDWNKVLEVLVISLPVFALMALGKGLERRRLLSPSFQDFINKIIYFLALPALIFNEVAKQRFSHFLNPGLLLPPVLATLALTLLYLLLVLWRRVQGGQAAAMVFGTVWANVAYMGFPLTQSAFGDEGLAMAAIYNAVLMPLQVTIGFLMIGFFGAGPSGSWRQKAARAFGNPVFIAAALGLLVAFIGESFRDSTGELHLWVGFDALIRLIASFLRLLGAMGLPLALLTIGASLRLGKISEKRWALLAVLVGKLLLLPLLTLLGIRLLFPEAGRLVTGIAVLLGSTPNAVASYVVSRQLDVDEPFVSSLLVLSTAISIVTIPTWLYFVL